MNCKRKYFFCIYTNFCYKLESNYFISQLPSNTLGYYQIYCNIVINKFISPASIYRMTVLYGCDYFTLWKMRQGCAVLRLLIICSCDAVRKESLPNFQNEENGESNSNRKLDAV